MGPWLKKELRPMVKVLLSSERLNPDGLLNSRLVEDMVKSHELGQEDFTEPIFALLTFQIWLDKFRVGLP